MVTHQIKKIKLHRLVTNAPEDKYVDHINGNRLDCRNDNLRFCTHQENCMNSAKRKNNSGERGIRMINEHCYTAHIWFNQQNIYLGIFDTIEEAVEVRQKAEIKYFGEFSPSISRSESNTN